MLARSSERIFNPSRYTGTKYFTVKKIELYKISYITRFILFYTPAISNIYIYVYFISKCIYIYISYLLL